MQHDFRLDWTHLIISHVAAEGVVGRTGIDSLNHVGGNGQASSVGKACAQQWVHVILLLKIREGEHSVIRQILILLWHTSSNVPATLQSNSDCWVGTAHMTEVRMQSIQSIWYY